MNESLTLQLDSENTHVAHHLFQKYAKEGAIPLENIKRMIQDIYGNTLELTKKEIESASRDLEVLLDYDKDGQIGFGDIENFVSGYLSEFSNSIIEAKPPIFEEQNRSNKIKINMSNSFQSFEMDNLEIAYDIFDDYDVEKRGMINRNELACVIRDVCTSLGVKDAVDKEILDRNINEFQFQYDGYVTWDEFRELYLQHFNF